MARSIPAPDDDLCLAYANTRYWRGTATPTEDLNGADDLLRWAEKTERLPPAFGEALRRAWRQRPACTDFGDAIGLRETIFRCFAATGRAACTGGRRPGRAERRARRWHRRGSGCVRAAGMSACRSLGQRDAGTNAMVGCAICWWDRSFARVRQCANPACGWLFLDNSKSGNRRWCSMSACGNRAKAHRHYLRQKEK